jgi:hypothetical protein
MIKFLYKKKPKRKNFNAQIIQILIEIIKGIVQNVFLRLFCKCRTVMEFGQMLVEPTGTLFWRPLDVLLFRRALKYFSQLFRQFRILNCKLSDNLKNLPTLFQKWFEYFHQNKN